MTFMGSNATLAEHIAKHFPFLANTCTIQHEELTVVVPADKIHSVCLTLRDEPELGFNMLIDVCGIDYVNYGVGEWATQQATGSGFDRGVEAAASIMPKDRQPARFAVIYHLLSLSNNHRIRLRCFVEDNAPIIDSIIDVWQSADWFEREAFDLFGILFRGHPDLRRILTDYGFIGHPFRKDFPLIGQVEMRYDAKSQRVVYEPVSIKPRVLVPKVLRDDPRYNQLPADEKR
jgi:NADH-quinone oxidoreductase subunit C